VKFGVRFAPHATAMLAGAAAVLGFSPFDFFPAALAALAALVHLWVRAATPRAAFILGFWFGFGFFLAGVSWVYVSLYRFGGMAAPIAGFSTLAFCAFLALFPALAGWVQARLAAPLLRPLLIPAAWVLTEWLRGFILTGFPWLSIGYAALDTPLAGFAPLGGVYLMSFGSVLAATLLWQLASGVRRLPAAAAFAVLGVAGWLLGGVEWTRPAGAPVSVSLLQGNVPQSMKFEPSRYARTLDTYARLADESRARLIILPETAVPRFLERIEPAYLARLDRIARRNGGDLLLGVPTSSSTGEYFNSVVSLGASPPGRYDKVHLVPFGEFVPWGFGWIVRLMSIPLSDFSRGSPRQQPLKVAGQKVAINICYEDAYGDEIARQLPEASLLVNVSNVAWFGDSLAPAQHLQIARLRALETGRAHLTATNTGITAAIGADGKVMKRLPQFEEGRLDFEAQGRSGATPYVFFEDGPALALAALLLFFCARRGRSR
jgi:apolipoprotein N-acyltransferase